MRETGTEGAAPPQEDAPLLGAVIDGRYRVDRYLRRNGSGGLFLGADLRDHRPVVLKFLAAELGADPIAAQLFAEDARASSLPEHPNLVTTLGSGKHQGRPYLVTSLAEGDTVADRVRAGSFALPTAATIAIQVCDALEHLHELGLTHGAIRPENLIVVDDEGPRVVVDFGLFHGAASSFAPLQVKDVFFGCPEYLAPEQAKGTQGSDQRSDLYALGVTFYELVTGRLPFYASSTAELLLRHMFSPPPPASSFHPDLPNEVDRFVERALAKDPSARFQTAAQMRMALEELREGSEVVLTDEDLVPFEELEAIVTIEHPPPASPEAPPEEAQPVPAVAASWSEERAGRSRRPRRLLLLLLLLVLIGAALTAWILTRPGSAPPAGVATSSARPVAVPARVPDPPRPVASAEAPAPSAAPVAPAPAANAVAAPLPPRPDRREHHQPRKRRRPRKTKRARPPAKKKASPAAPILAGLGVSSSPSGALVVAGGKTLGRTPLANARLAPGGYEVVVSKAGHQPWKTRITLAGGAAVHLNARLDPLPGVLHLVIKEGKVATWASISIDGEAVLESHTVRRKLPAGRHRITVRRPGYRRVTRTISVPPGGTRKVRLQIERADRGPR